MIGNKERNKNQLEKKDVNLVTRFLFVFVFVFKFDNLEVRQKFESENFGNKIRH
jgi:hypothetical protein